MRLAARGARDLDGGMEMVADPAEVARLRGQAARIHREAAVAASLATGLALLVAALAV